MSRQESRQVEGGAPQPILSETPPDSMAGTPVGSSGIVDEDTDVFIATPPFNQ